MLRGIPSKTAALVCTLAMIMSLPALGWGQTGHRVIGEIAQRHLSDTASLRIGELLPNESLAEASTYPDEMRSNPSTFWKKTASPWHYVTVPEGKHYHEVGAPVEGDAVTALAQFTATIKDPMAPLADKQLALRFVVHIIGDLHQPLHAGNGKDRGGNDVKVHFFGEPSNLHRVWDSQLLDQRKLSFTEWTDWLDSKITTRDRDNWGSVDPLVWIAESTAIRDSIYPENSNNVSYDYLYQHLPTVKQRLQQAGIRLALYLDSVFED